MTGNQQSVTLSLHRLTPWRGEKTSLIIVTGEAGAGKSLVLRTFARGLSTRALNGHPASERLPFFMPLQQFGRVAVLQHADIWKSLVESWLVWINRLSGGACFTPMWLETRLSTKPGVLILDSVDEFLMNNPQVTPDEFVNLIEYLRDKYYGGPDISVVLGIRAESPILGRLQGRADHNLTVRSPEDHEAKKHFPGAYEIIKRLRTNWDKDITKNESGDRAITTAKVDSDLARVLRTPLILASLEGAVFHDADLLVAPTRSGVFALALKAVIKKSRLDAKTMGGRLSQNEEWGCALMLAAMFFSAGHHGQMEQEEIRAAREITEKNWGGKGFDEAFTKLMPSFDILKTDATLNLLFERTVFFPVGPLRWRFKHRLWQDYLFGCYFAFCIRALNLLEITRVAFTAQAFTMGGEILAAEGWKGFDESFSEAVIERMTGRLGQFVIGNVGGLIGNHFLPVTESAMLLLKEHHQKMPSPGKLTFIGGLGFRVLKKDEDDPSWQVLHDTLVPILQDCVERVLSASPAEVAPSGPERILASISWCYLAEFVRDFQTGAPAPPWPELILTDEQERAVLDGLLAEMQNGDLVATPLFQSVQFAYLAIQQDLLEESDSRPISIVHYLYTLTLACKYRVATDEIRDGVLAILDPRSQVGKIFVDSPLKEIGSIYRLCQQMKADFRSPKPRSAPVTAATQPV